MGRKSEPPRTVAVYCPTCKIHRVIDVRCAADTEPYYDGRFIDDWTDRTILGVCQDCKQSVVIRDSFSHYNPSEENYSTVYPHKEADTRRLSFPLPKQIELSYTEAVNCERSKAWMACVVMVGRALEAVAKDFNSKVKTISTGIGKMHEAGIISDELFEWANELRILRNIGAHASDENVIESDAHEALDFLQAILEIIYHLRPMFQRMKERRTQT